MQDVNIKVGAVAADDETIGNAGSYKFGQGDMTGILPRNFISRRRIVIVNAARKLLLFSL